MRLPDGALTLQEDRYKYTEQDKDREKKRENTDEEANGGRPKKTVCVLSYHLSKSLTLN